MKGGRRRWPAPRADPIRRCRRSWELVARTQDSWNKTPRPRPPRPKEARRVFFLGPDAPAPTRQLCSTASSRLATSHNGAEAGRPRTPARSLRATASLVTRLVTASRMILGPDAAPRGDRFASPPGRSPGGSSRPFGPAPPACWGAQRPSPARRGARAEEDLAEQPSPSGAAEGPLLGASGEAKRPPPAARPRWEAAELLLAEMRPLLPSRLVVRGRAWRPHLQAAVPEAWPEAWAFMGGVAAPHRSSAA